MPATLFAGNLGIERRDACRTLPALRPRNRVPNSKGMASALLSPWLSFSRNVSCHQRFHAPRHLNKHLRVFVWQRVFFFAVATNAPGTFVEPPFSVHDVEE